ncbi:MAG TPA: xanthine dehydrogenase family protein molybdopterin-binding subunit [Ramlibacter sp.]|nr:xanthine dehydrogenase family protein molybdopterin-binding subunit [Ramlibacter sp.]
MSDLSNIGRFGIGQAAPRTEDDRLLRGRGEYTDDVVPDGQLRAVFLRSPYPHARIVAIDTAVAAAMPGVARVITGAELVAAGVGHIPTLPKMPDGSIPITPDCRVLAFERVRFVGEAVVLVVAETLQQGRDAAEAVSVEYEELPHVVTLEAATAPGAPQLCEGADRNIAAQTRYGDKARCASAFAAAAHVVKLDVVNQRVAPLTIEPRSVIAWTTADGRLTVRMANQKPSGLRYELADHILRVPRDRVRITIGDVGGGFGLKTHIHPEDGAVAWAAWNLKRPVKWIADRSEEFLSAVHARDQRAQAELALDRDGRILGLRVRTLANTGAYASWVGLNIPLIVGPMVGTSVYHVPVIDYHFQGVLTNTMSIGPYRGAGRPESVFIIERLVEEAARQMGIDRVELRRRNFIRPEQMPYTTPMKDVYDVGQFERIMDEGLALADWKGFEARAAQSKARGRLRGLGIATFVEWAGGLTWTERVTVEVRADGVIEVFAAVNQMGQGIATTLAQTVVQVFDVPLDKVRVVLGDTDRGDGHGSAGSRSMFTAGSAMHRGSESALRQARQLASQALEVAPDDLEYADARFKVKGSDVGIGLFELVRRQPEQRIYLEHSSAVAGPSWPNGCHVSEVEIDPDTGVTRVVRYSSVNDIGTVVNPTIVRGQLDGAVLQGIGQALMEHVVYDPESGQLLTGSLMDYAAPRADLMACDFINETNQTIPCKNNHLGVKGVGELGTIGAMPAIVNAVADALARAGKAAAAPRLQMPLTPPKLWKILSKETT